MCKFLPKNFIDKLEDVKEEKRKYAVCHTGYVQHFVNENLLKKMGKLDNLKRIKELQVNRMNIMIRLKEASDSETKLLRQLSKDFESNEKELQKAWGFKEDKNYHEFWELPHCTCPKLENKIKYPNGSYSVNNGCPLHGEVK